jgi:dUTP pyrophosphatase
VGVILINLGEAPYGLKRGDRIAQLVISRVEPVEWEEIEDAGALGESARGGGGFGSTGI